jgi:glycosyltransferase involved in cell wall biosynthesis
VAPFYAIADIFVLPSLSEGSPNALLEAMAAGLPIVATDAGGISEIAADDVNALLVPPCDADALARAVAALLADPARCERLARVAQLTVRRDYTPEQRAAVLTSVYRKLLEPGRTLLHRVKRYDRGNATTAPALVP